MSEQHDLMPWYSWLPLPTLILAMPFAFVAFCGNQWLPEQSTFATLAKHKQKPQLRTWSDGKRVRLDATSWLSWPPLEFTHCDLQPTQKPRYAICMGDSPTEAMLVRADTEQLVLTGILSKTPAQGRWLADGHRYLWGEQLIETKPQLSVEALPSPLQDLALSPEERPQFLSLSTDQEYALWRDRRPQPDGSVLLIVNRISDGREESTLTIDNPGAIAELSDPTASSQLVQKIVWWTDLRRRHRVMLRPEQADDEQSSDPSESDR